MDNESFKMVIEAAPNGQAIVDEADSIKMLLLEKNILYGNSALEPVRIFSTSSTEEQLLVRIDDKLNRLRSVGFHDDEDVVLDLIGYLILLRVHGNMV